MQACKHSRARRAAAEAAARGPTIAERRARCRAHLSSARPRSLRRPCSHALAATPALRRASAAAAFRRPKPWRVAAVRSWAQAPCQARDAHAQARHWAAARRRADPPKAAAAVSLQAAISWRARFALAAARLNRRRARRCARRRRAVADILHGHRDSSQSHASRRRLCTAKTAAAAARPCKQTPCCALIRRRVHAARRTCLVRNARHASRCPNGTAAAAHSLKARPAAAAARARRWARRCDVAAGRRVAANS
eukprot:scaffold9425_cov99-Isochrysis_galbana.AAC.3